MEPQPGVELELITDELTPGTRSCWGFMHTPLVRHGGVLHAATLEAGRLESGPGSVPWMEQEGIFRLFRKEGDGPWAESFRGASQQTVCLLLSPDGTLRAIGGLGPEAWTASGEGRAGDLTLERLGNLGGHPYHGAGIGPEGNACVSWCEQKTERVGIYDADKGAWTVRDIAEVPEHTGYPYVVVHGRSVHIIKHEAIVLEGKFCYRVLYHLHSEDGANGAWRQEILDDAGPGHCECQAVFVDLAGQLHVVYRRNPKDYDKVWDPLDPGNRFVHLVGPPGGPFERSEIEVEPGIHSVRLCQTPDGRYHLFLEKGQERTAREKRTRCSRLFHRLSEDGQTYSNPKSIQLLPDGTDRLFLLEPSRSGGDRLDTTIEGFATGPYPMAHHQVYYVRIDPSTL
jgi:hypothetical protein